MPVGFSILLDAVYANYYIAHMTKSKDYKVIQNDNVPKDLFAVGMRKGDKTLRKKDNAGLVLACKKMVH